MPAFKISPKTLHQWLAEPDPPIIVDVRDEDRIGGHIKGSINVPSSTYESELENLTVNTSNASRIVFHCQLSQQRGPSCAARFLEKCPEANVYILSGGFNAWAQEYGSNKTVTEDFQSWLYE